MMDPKTTTKGLGTTGAPSAQPAKAWTALIPADALQALLQSGTPCVVLDCGFDLADPSAGARAWAQGHLPGAQYAHLEQDLSGPQHAAGPRSPAFTGRHPLPERAALAAWAGGLGIAPGVQVVVYDNQDGPYAARAWWLLRWLGHSACAVLDGGQAAWLRAGGALVQGEAPVQHQAPYPAGPSAMPLVDAQQVMAQMGRAVLLDARAAPRFRGEQEPLDPVAGHIPGARNRFFKENLDAATGCFKPAEQLRREFLALGFGDDAGPVLHQCGSGVTACHNLLAMEAAGLAGSSLYPGSWSEWCADPARPIARG